ncbi:MAG: hypothetical protein ACREOQ_11435 [Gemmatimonadales bacterium]
MPSPRGPKPDPLSREVDRLLAGLSTMGAQSSRDDRPPSRAPSPSRVASRAAPGVAPPIAATRGDRAALWARVVLGLVFGGVMTQWPYRHECGLPLLGYLGAVAMVMVAGTWIAVASWSRRHALIHTLGILLLFWGIVLAAEQVLPRIGYAAERWAWGCGT